MQLPFSGTPLHVLKTYSIVCDFSITTTTPKAKWASDAAILYAGEAKSFLPHCTEEAIVRKTPKHVLG